MVLVAANVCAAPVTLDQTPSPPAAELPAELARNPALPGAPRVDGRASVRPLAALPEASGAQSHSFDARIERPINRSPGRADAARPQENGKQENGKPGQAPAGTGPAGEGSDLDPDLKEAAKAARQWIEESVPWARQKSSGVDDSPEQRPRQGDATDPERPAPGVYPGTGGDTRAPRVGISPAELNFLSEILKFAKDVFGHPMVWLVIALIVIGSAWMSMAKRRSK
jgi:hypothetical protein